MMDDEKIWCCVFSSSNQFSCSSQVDAPHVSISSVRFYVPKDLRTPNALLLPCTPGVRAKFADICRMTNIFEGTHDAR
jgi:hypothetical protein